MRGLANEDLRTPRPSKPASTGGSSRGSVLDMLGLGSKGSGRPAAALADGGDVPEVDDGHGSDEGGSSDFAASPEQKVAAQEVMGAIKSGDSAKFLRALQGLLYMLDDAGGDADEAPAAPSMPTKRTSIFDR